MIKARRRNDGNGAIFVPTDKDTNMNNIFKIAGEI
jgi:hypothetical protein